VPKIEQRAALFAITNWLLFLAGIANLSIGTWAACHENTTIAATSLTAGLVLLLAGNIDRFESLKGLGMEAKTRKLDQKINEATDVLDRLREVAELTGESLITLQSSVGRLFSAPTPEYTYATAQKIRSNLVAVGSSQGAIKETLSSWVDTFTADMAAALFVPIQKQVEHDWDALKTHAFLAQAAKNTDVLAEAYARIQFVGAYLEKSKSVRNLAADNPTAFLKHVTDAPVLDPVSIETHVVKIRVHAQEMLDLAANLELAKPEAWFQVIAASRNPEQVAAESPPGKSQWVSTD